MAKIKTVADLKKMPEADLIVNHILERKRRGLYTLILVSGLPGSGKTSTCCRLAEKVSRALNGGENHFNVTHISDNFLDLLKFAKQADPKDNTTTVGVVEEVSVLFPSRRAMSGDNVDLAKLLDTMRKKEIIIFANAPIWPTIDGHMRSMGCIYIETIRIYKHSELVFSKCFKLQTNPGTGKTYKHTFKRGNREVSRMYTLKPDPHIWDKYEEKKDAFIDLLYQKAEARALKRKREDEKLLESLNPKQVEALTGREIAVYDAVHVKKMKKIDIAQQLGISPSMITVILKEIKRKKEELVEN